MQQHRSTSHITQQCRARLRQGGYKGRAAGQVVVVITAKSYRPGRPSVSEFHVEISQKNR
ncbi:hypothetical protein E2C01_019221 [Portunus trituberculatus]|uniref:Uncharacterized protein n=1 Tax=Portunus trituberculatus TaxID=210409 RepID=A0A5B7DX02_PORTR|nr:hypothetical protein [Portunus trituberculatus]